MLKQEEDSGCGITQDKIFFLAFCFGNSCYFFWCKFINWNSALKGWYSKPSTFLLQSQEGSIPFGWSKSNQVAVEGQTNRPVPSSSILSTANSLTTGSNKSSSPRHVPVVSQLSLSRPQCSFVHIDGVQCGAVTWSKYVTFCFVFCYSCFQLSVNSHL